MGGSVIHDAADQSADTPDERPRGHGPELSAARDAVGVFVRVEACEC